MSARVVIRMPGEGKEITLAGQPMTFLVTGQDSKHTSMFEWTIPARFSTGLHVHRVQEETFYVIEGECEWRVGDESIHATPARTCSSRPVSLTTSPTRPTSLRRC